VKIDFDIEEMTVQTNSPEWDYVKRDAFLLNYEFCSAEPSIA
jgi:hypothetical protein